MATDPRQVRTAQLAKLGQQSAKAQFEAEMAQLKMAEAQARADHTQRLAQLAAGQARGEVDAADRQAALEAQQAREKAKESGERSTGNTGKARPLLDPVQLNVPTGVQDRGFASLVEGVGGGAGAQRLSAPAMQRAGTRPSGQPSQVTGPAGQTFNVPEEITTRQTQVREGTREFAPGLFLPSAERVSTTTTEPNVLTPFQALQIQIEQKRLNDQIQRSKVELRRDTILAIEQEFPGAGAAYARAMGEGDLEEADRILAGREGMSASVRRAQIRASNAQADAALAQAGWYQARTRILGATQLHDLAGIPGSPMDDMKINQLYTQLGQVLDDKGLIDPKKMAQANGLMAAAARKGWIFAPEVGKGEGFLGFGKGKAALIPYQQFEENLDRYAAGDEQARQWLLRTGLMVEAALPDGKGVGLVSVAEIDQNDPAALPSTWALNQYMVRKRIYSGGERPPTLSEPTLEEEPSGGAQEFVGPPRPSTRGERMGAVVRKGIAHTGRESARAAGATYRFIGEAGDEKLRGPANFFRGLLFGERER